MAELTVFGYHPGSSWAHGLDIRFKLLFLVVISLASVKAGLLGLLILSLFLVGTMRNARLDYKTFFKEIRYVLVLVAFVFAARALAMPGEIVIKFKYISITREGLYQGLVVGWRLVTIVMLGLTFVATSRSSEIRAAVEWVLSPIPLIPAKRVSTMIGLLTRFVPMILGQAKETAEAQRARGIEKRKNPVYRIVKLGIPLIWRTFNSADKLVDAMEARCYNDNRTGPEFSLCQGDWRALVVVSLLGILVACI